MAGKQFDYAVRRAATLYTAHSYRYTVQFKYSVQFTDQFTATPGGSDDGSSHYYHIYS